MKIRMISTLPRLQTIPGEITLGEYRSLQAGDAVEVDSVSADYLQAAGFAVPVEPPKESEE